MIPQELHNLKLKPHPHLVIVGAGASYAATPHAERNGRKMPLMRELPDALDLRSVLNVNQFKAACKDFEAFYDSLVSSRNTRLQQIIEDRVISFFDTVRIASHVTLYDRLILSLRRKDAIATFNWDPLLTYAYRRNGKLQTLPALLFLHGNTRLGVCTEHNRLGWNDDKCLDCGKPLKTTRLLYPVGRKDYSSDPIISEQWNHLDWYVENSYFVTIFGYSAPKTDVDARSRIIDKLSENTLKRLMQIEIVDPNCEQLIRANLSPIIKGTHYGHMDRFEHSWLSQFPRLTCEALYQATMMLDPVVPYPLPQTNQLSELQDWALGFHTYFPGFLKEGAAWQG